MTLGHYKRHATSHALITPKKTPNEKILFRCSLSLRFCLQRGVLRKANFCLRVIVCVDDLYVDLLFCYCLSYRVYQQRQRGMKKRALEKFLRYPLLALNLIRSSAARARVHRRLAVFRGRSRAQATARSPYNTVASWWCGTQAFSCQARRPVQRKPVGLLSIRWRRPREQQDKKG